MLEVVGKLALVRHTTSGTNTFNLQLGERESSAPRNRFRPPRGGSLRFRSPLHLATASSRHRAARTRTNPTKAGRGDKSRWNRRATGGGLVQFPAHCRLATACRLTLAVDVEWALRARCGWAHRGKKWTSGSPSATSSHWRRASHSRQLTCRGGTRA